VHHHLDRIAVEVVDRHTGRVEERRIAVVVVVHTGRVEELRIRPVEEDIVLEVAEHHSHLEHHSRLASYELSIAPRSSLTSQRSGVKSTPFLRISSDSFS